jgi:tetratricopeptide (TPR) repeat protein/V8-like Glu-specific endopeptidase
VKILLKDSAKPMNIQYGLSSAIVGTVAVVCFQAQVAVALSADEVAQVARQVTVQIKSVSNGPGSGFIIKQSGQTYTVLTAAHVVAIPSRYTVHTSDGQKYDVNAGTIKLFEDADLAVVQFTSSQRYQIAKLGNSAAVPLLSPAYVSGFPATSLTGTETTYRVSPGIIAAQASRPRADGYALAYFNDTFGGMSGGPVLNSAGEVIGIHGRSESEFRKPGQKGIDPRTGVKLGLNLAIPINLFLDLAAKELPNLGFKNKSKPNTARLQTAKSKLSQALTADDFFLQGVEKHALGNRQKAIADYTQAIKLNPKFAAAYVTRGYARYQANDFAGSITDFDQGISANINFEEAYNGRGNSKAALEDAKGAFADYDHVVRVNSKNSVAYANRANARIALGDPQGAITDCEYSIRLNPNNATAYSNCGDAYTAVGKKTKAFEYLDEAIRINPSDSMIYNNRGITYFKIGKNKEAVSEYTQALSLDPNNFAALANRGVSRRLLNDFEGAITDYDQALKLNPNLPIVYANRSLLRFKLGDREGTISDLKKAEALFKTQENQAGLKIVTQLLQNYGER